MKYLVIFLILIGFAGFTIPQAFGAGENLFSGAATFERLPVTLSPNAEAKFEIKFQYTEGTYSLSNVTAIADITPKGAAAFVHFDAEPFDVYQNSIVRIPVTISVDPGIEYEKIFLNISYVGTGINSVSFKSSWSDSIMFDIIPNEMTEISLNNCSPIDLESAISGGVLQFVCHSSMTNSVRAIINADSDGTVTLEIPKFLLYSLTDSQCNVSNDFLVLVKGREVTSEITDNKNTNSVTLDFAKGITEIEIMGTTILPDPSPAQYCGIVEGYEKQFLAPLDQTNRGVKAEFIRCNVGLVLTQRIDDSPVCVKPQTLQKLRERGWAKLLFEIQIQPDQTYQELDEEMSESNYDPSQVRCSSGIIPYIPENWQTTGMHPSDETWETLNRHLMVQFFFKELQNRNIVFEPACFGVYTGLADEIYPPSYSMCSVVTASNGTTLYLEGTIREFDVTYFDIDNEIPYQCDDNQGSCLCGIENEN